MCPVEAFFHPLESDSDHYCVFHVLIIVVPELWYRIFMSNSWRLYNAICGLPQYCQMSVTVWNCYNYSTCKQHGGSGYSNHWPVQTL